MDDRLGADAAAQLLKQAAQLLETHHPRADRNTALGVVEARISRRDPLTPYLEAWRSLCQDPPIETPLEQMLVIASAEQVIAAAG